MTVHALKQNVAKQNSKTQPGLSETEKHAQHPGRAIVTYSRSLMALVIARSLAAKGVEVISCDDVDMTVTSFSKASKAHFVHPSFTENKEVALDALERKVRAHAPDDDRPYVLIPSFRDAQIFSEYRDRFEPLIKIAAPAFEAIDEVHPKHHLIKLAREFELPIPDTQILKGGKDCIALPHCSWPKIIKPVDGVGGRGVKTLKNADPLKRYLADTAPDDLFLLQELVEGEDFCVSVAAQDGKLTGVVAYKNLRQFPQEAGAGAVRETVDPTPFLTTVKTILEMTQWTGVAEIDFRWDGASQTHPKLIEVNPRFWAGLFHSVESDVDFPWLAFQQASGRDLPEFDPTAVKVGKQTKTTGAWALSLMEDIASDDETFDAIAAAWQRAKLHVRQGKITPVLKQLSGVISGDEQTLKDRLENHKEQYAAIADLPSELELSEDPATGLGLLFAVSSLVRHGKLPDELRYEKKRSSTDQNAAPQTHQGRPRIGITHGENRDRVAVWFIKLGVWLAGGKPVSITAKAPIAPQSLDGLVFGGGTDIYPERYRGKRKRGYRYDLARDELEASWAHAAKHEDLPVLGVCRGMQMLNVVEGGTLWEDLSHLDVAYPTALWRRLFFRKPMCVDDDTLLSKLLGTSGEVAVNSLHSQAIKEPAACFEVWAKEPNGIIQAIGAPSRKFWLGVQFHPEFLLHKTYCRALFKGLVEAANTRAQARLNA